MNRRWTLSGILLGAFLASITVGVSIGEGERDFLLTDHKSNSKVAFRDILTTDANVMILTETTCYSCIKELKAMELLRSRYKGKVSVTAVFLDRQEWGRVKKYLDLYQFDLDFILEDSSQVVPTRFQANFVPTLIIFDREGKEIHRKQGYTDGEESMLAGILDDILYPGQKAAATPVAAGTPTAPVQKSSGCASTPS